MNAVLNFAAIAFDPNIRGVLVVLIGMVTLMGSIFMILSTNSGVRVGFLVAASALFGWMFLLGSVWVIYGIGFKGRDPSWVPTDINLTRTAPVSDVPEVASLPPDDQLPKATSVLGEYPLVHAMLLGSEGDTYAPVSLTKLKTADQPLIIMKAPDVKALGVKALAKGGAVFATNPDVKSMIEAGGDPLSNELHRQATKLREEIEKPLGKWCLLTEADPRRGDTVASTDAALAANKTFGETTDTSNYIVKDVFFYGGKDPCHPIEERSQWWRAVQRVRTTLEVKNPTLLAVTTLVKTKDQPTIAGQAPPLPVAEPGATTVSVIQMRNLGSRRFVPFLVMLVSLSGFVIFTTILHYRDKTAMEIRAAFTATSKK